MSTWKPGDDERWRHRTERFEVVVVGREKTPNGATLYRRVDAGEGRPQRMRHAVFNGVFEPVHVPPQFDRYRESPGTLGDRLGLLQRPTWPSGRAYSDREWLAELLSDPLEEDDRPGDEDLMREYWSRHQLPAQEAYERSRDENRHTVDSAHSVR